MGDDAAPQYKVFVGGLTWDLTNEQLQEGKGCVCCACMVLVVLVPCPGGMHVVRLVNLSVFHIGSCGKRHRKVGWCWPGVC